MAVGARADVDMDSGFAGAIEAVVIGASAGGVQALSILLPALPSGMPGAVFVVLHLPRDKPSLLPELFQSRCAVPVREAMDKEPVQGGTVYFAAPDYHLLIDLGPQGPQLAVSADEPVNHSRPSIDVLFESAAEVYGGRLMGIILTGANQDGAAGLKAVRRAGGLAVAQRPDTAANPPMPAAAIASSDPQRVLTLPEIASLLHSWCLGQSPLR